MFAPHASPTEVFREHQGEMPDYSQVEAGLPVQVGHNLRTVRSQLALGQRSLARRMDVSLSQYRKYETGQDLPRLHSALMWSIDTGIPTHWLFRDTHYQQWLDVPFRTAWVPVLHFINRAPHWSLQALQSVLTGLLDCHGETEALLSVDEERRKLSSQLLRDPYYRSVSEKLRAFREGLGLSQETAADIMGVSLTAYRKYETPDLCPHFSINMIMRFWVATGTNPIGLSSETPVFRYRQKQSHNFGILLPLLERLDEAGLKRVSDLSRVLAAPD